MIKVVTMMRIVMDFAFVINNNVQDKPDRLKMQTTSMIRFKMVALRLTTIILKNILKIIIVTT